MSDIHKLTGAYALDAVDDIERATFERHLAECEDCRTEVASLRETTALLAESAAVSPPPSLRDSVLSGISQVRPLPPVVAPPRRAAWFPLLVAAALVAVLGVGAAIWQPWAPSTTGSLTAAERVIQAPDAQQVEVDLGDAGRATVIRSKSVGKAVIKTEDMDSPPAGKVFALWLESKDGEMVPAGLMPNDPDQTYVLDGDAATAQAAGITVEPEGEPLDEPTLPIVAVFDFSQAT
jgi:anti-sigma-K factor RskA